LDFFKKPWKRCNFFYENMLGKFLGFGCMRENKIFFFVFEKGN
jgi:hypothetical protein